MEIKQCTTEQPIEHQRNLRWNFKIKEILKPRVEWKQKYYIPKAIGCRKTHSKREVRAYLQFKPSSKTKNITNK